MRVNLTFALENALKAQKGVRYSSYPQRYVGVGGLRHPLAFLPLEIDPVIILQEAE